MMGWWAANAFNLDYDTVALIAYYRLHITPAPNGIAIHLTERTGTIDAMLTAVPQHAAPQPALPLYAAPQPVAPQPVAPQPVAPQPVAPQPAGH
jgi:hypothetical protein